MTKEELRAHCEKQVKMCEEWAKGNGREPSGKIYEEHKLILDLIKSLEQQSSEDAISLQAVINMTGLSNWFESSDDYNNFVEELCTLPLITPTFPKNATNGDMILTMFDTAAVYGIDKENDYITICIDNNFYQKFRYSWWNAQYKRGNEA